MSKRLDVLERLKAVITAALPNADVKGLSADDAKPASVGPGGLVVIRSGDPGEPSIDLSPTTYYYDHSIPLEIAAYESASLTSEEVLDAMLGAIGAAIAADRTLGGLCDYVEAVAPSTEDFELVGAMAGRFADALVVASYSTTDPFN